MKPLQHAPGQSEDQPEAAGVSLVSDLRDIFRLTATYRWATPVLILVGLAASLAETLGITLVVLFLYLAMGKASALDADGGLLAELVEPLTSVFGAGMPLVGLIFAMIVARGLLSLGYSLISAEIRSKVSEAVRNQLHAQLLSVSYAYVRRHEQSQLLELLATESWSIASIHGSVTRIVINFCSISIFTAFLLALSWRITAVALAGSLIVFTGMRLLSRPAQQLGAEMKSINQSLAERILVTLQGMRTIRAFGQEQAQHAAFESVSAASRRIELRLERLYAFLNPATEIGALAVLCFIIGMSGWLQATFATTMASVALLYRLQPHIREFEGNLLNIAELRTRLRSVVAMLDRSDKSYAPAGRLDFTKLQDDIRFENVSFSYPGAASPSLDRASFSIRRRGTTAIVGVSGAGKTTIVNLLLRLYQPDGGRIMVNGSCLDEIRRVDWLSRIAVAGQDVDLIEGTIADNIRMARPDADLAMVRSAAASSGLLPMIDMLPDGFDTWIGQQGMNLSGGQRQRVGLARAILLDPQLLILDEAMSALDRGLEDELRANIRHGFRDRAVILITHRLETILSADHAICIHGGEVQEAGNPRNLLGDSNSMLARLFRRVDYSEKSG